MDFRVTVDSNFTKLLLFKTEKLILIFNYLIQNCTLQLLLFTLIPKCLLPTLLIKLLQLLLILLLVLNFLLNPLLLLLQKSLLSFFCHFPFVIIMKQSLTLRIHTQRNLTLTTLHTRLIILFLLSRFEFFHLK